MDSDDDEIDLVEQVTRLQRENKRLNARHRELLEDRSELTRDCEILRLRNRRLQGQYEELWKETLAPRTHDGAKHEEP
jgi:chromosome segregation ATPase